MVYGLACNNRQFIIKNFNYETDYLLNQSTPRNINFCT